MHQKQFGYAVAFIFRTAVHRVCDCSFAGQNKAMNKDTELYDTWRSLCQEWCIVAQLPLNHSYEQGRRALVQLVIFWPALMYYTSLKEVMLTLVDHFVNTGAGASGKQ